MNKDYIPTGEVPPSGYKIPMPSVKKTLTLT